MTPEPTFQRLSSEERATIDWHISTFSENGGAACVEAGALRDGTGRVAVRHSHHPEGAHIVYTRQEWEAFTKGIRAGEFDFDA
ncbi:DUF397 domain-containing protein [Nocardiopsis sp. NPDC049922]|uniref:DUF397 domain-containing protein n=1 Tax=Nocardiopsis sp. NPDC049922 TaxID=3155157 RepID=UPI0033E9E259